MDESVGKESTRSCGKNNILIPDAIYSDKKKDGYTKMLELKSKEEDWDRITKVKSEKIQNLKKEYSDEVCKEVEQFEPRYDLIEDMGVFCQKKDIFEAALLIHSDWRGLVQTEIENYTMEVPEESMLLEEENSDDFDSNDEEIEHTVNTSSSSDVWYRPTNSNGRRKKLSRSPPIFYDEVEDEEDIETLLGTWVPELPIKNNRVHFFLISRNPSGEGFLIQQFTGAIIFLKDDVHYISMLEQKKISRFTYDVKKLGPGKVQFPKHDPDSCHYGGENWVRLGNNIKDYKEDLNRKYKNTWSNWVWKEPLDLFEMLPLYTSETSV